MAACPYCRMSYQLCLREAAREKTRGLIEGRVPEEKASSKASVNSGPLASLLKQVKTRLQDLAGLLVCGGPPRMSWEMVLASTGPKFASELPPRFFDQHQSEDGSVTLTMRETDAGELMLDLEAQSAALDRTLWQFSLLGEGNREVQVGFVVLAPWVDGQRWVAEIGLGSLADVAREVGQDFQVVAYPLKAESLTEEHREALLWSVEAIAGDRDAVAAWNLFMEQSLEHLAPDHRLIALLQDIKSRLQENRGERGPFAGAMPDSVWAASVTSRNR